MIGLFHEAVGKWFRDVFDSPTRPQKMGWPAISGGACDANRGANRNGKRLSLPFCRVCNRLMFSRCAGRVESLPCPLYFPNQSTRGGR